MPSSSASSFFAGVNRADELVAAHLELGASHLVARVQQRHLVVGGLHLRVGVQLDELLLGLFELRACLFQLLLLLGGIERQHQRRLR